MIGRWSRAGGWTTVPLKKRAMILRCRSGLVVISRFLSPRIESHKSLGRRPHFQLGTLRGKFQIRFRVDFFFDENARYYLELLECIARPFPDSAGRYATWRGKFKS